MSVSHVKLNDADEIQAFFHEATGMIPGYTQLSRGAANLTYSVVDLDGVRLLWAQNRAQALWRDQMSVEGGLQLGYVIDAEAEVIAQGVSATPDTAILWLEGQDMEYLHKGPMATLEIWVCPELVDQLGWDVSGDVLKNLPAGRLAGLTETCRRATLAAPSTLSDRVEVRGIVLEQLEQVLEPWLTPEPGGQERARRLHHYGLFARAERIYLAGEDPTPNLEAMARHMGVSRRTLFYAFRKTLGLGPHKYFEITRLNDLRRRLQVASRETTTVTAQATELGFNDLGRLSERYRAMFGENPSVTLSRNVR